MRRLVATLTVAAVLAAGVPAWASTPALKDMNDHWARTQVESGIAAGYVAGYPDGSFRPNASITRAEFTKLLGAAMGLKQAQSPTGFSEEQGNPPHWSFQQGHIHAAVSAGLLVPGDYDNTLSPDTLITRREIVITAVRALGRESLVSRHPGSLKAPDAATYPTWLRPYAAIALESGIITGYEDGSLGLARTATRAEALVMVQRILSKVTAQTLQAPAPSGVRHEGEGEPTWAWSGGGSAPLQVTNGVAAQAYTLAAGAQEFALLPAPGKAAWIRYTQGGAGVVARLSQGKLTEVARHAGRLPDALAVDDYGRLWFTDGDKGLFVANSAGKVTQVTEINEKLRFGAVDWNGTFWGAGGAYIWRITEDLETMPYASEVPMEKFQQFLGLAEDGSMWFLTGQNGDNKAEAWRLAYGKVQQKVTLVGPYAGGRSATARVEVPGRTGAFVWAVVRTREGSAERLEGLYRFHLNTGEFARTVLPRSFVWNGDTAMASDGGALLRDTSGTFWRPLP